MARAMRHRDRTTPPATASGRRRAGASTTGAPRGRFSNPSPGERFFTTHAEAEIDRAREVVEDACRGVDHSYE